MEKSERIKSIFGDIKKVLNEWGLSYNEYYEMARLYWAQEQDHSLPVNEILFEGAVEIVEVVEEYEYKR